MSAKDELKANFNGNIDLAIKANLISQITAPTTKALLEWVQDELDTRLTPDQVDGMLDTAREAGYETGYDTGWENGREWVHDYGD